MPNVIASGTTVSNGTLKRNNFLIGVNTSVQYGPTSATTFWNGIVPAAGGYTIYAQKTVNGPSIRTAANDSELITIARQYGGTNINTISDALNYFNGQSNNLVTNIDYPSIVTSGLTLMYDAGYIPSYPTTGTTWNDLSGNVNNGTLTNGPTFDTANGGSIVFNGTNNYASTTNNITSTTATFISWVNQNGSQSAYTGILLSRISDATATGLGSSYGITPTTNQLGYLWNGAVNTYTWNSGLIIPTNAWCMAVISVSSTSATAYLCQSSGITTATNTVNHSSVTNNFDVGRDLATGVRFFNGKIAQSLLYDRALSATEVLQNYNATKSRFNLR